MPEFMITPLSRWTWVSWTCASCPAHSGLDPKRSDAEQHVKATGHTVNITRGDTEMLGGLATEPPETVTR